MKRHCYLCLALLFGLFTSQQLSGQTFTMSNTTITTCGGTLLDPGGFGNYANGELVVMTICGAANQCINLNWTLMDMESCCDFINIYDGPTTASTPIGGYTGTTLPPNISSSGNCITLEFFSDLSITGAGFSANISCGACGSGPAASTADCDSAIQVCSATTSFPITANGFGTFDEIPLTGSLGNPATNPVSANSGCLLSGELNSTWLIYRIQTPGLLEFHFGTGGFPQTGYYDWIMYDLTNNTCADISNNTLAPVRCNWNCSSAGGTGLAAAGNIPLGGSFCNYEPPLNVVPNQLFVVCFSNWSNSNGTVGFNFETNPGNAGVDCSPILNYHDLFLMVEEEEEGNRLTWVTPSHQEASQYLIERALDGDRWELLDLQDAENNPQFSYLDPFPAGGSARYRVGMLDNNGNLSHSNVVEVTLPDRYGIEVFPNPAQNEVQVRIGHPVREHLQAEILDVQGRTVASKSIHALNLEPLDAGIVVADLPEGLYFLRVNGRVARFQKAD